MRATLALAAAILCAGLAQAGAGATLVVTTVPAGGEVLVVDSGQRVPDGGAIELPAGPHTLRAQAPGYRAHEVKVTLEAGRETRVAVPLGTGYARVNIRSEPPGARIDLDGRRAGNAPLARELDAGRHRVRATLAGHYPVTQEVVAGPNQDLDLVLALRRVTTQAAVVVQADRDDAVIYYKDRKVGTGRAWLGYLDFGNYAVAAIAPVDEDHRRTGRRDFRVSKPSSLRVELALDTDETLFEKQWLPAAQARAAEEKRYRGQRVANPVAVRVTLDDAQLARLAARAELAGDLHRLLRVGDRVQFQAGKHEVVVWKRNGTRTRDFGRAVAALARPGATSPSFEPDAPAHSTAADAAADPVEAVAFALNRARAPQALLDLSGDELLATGETVARARSDGPLTVVIAGGAVPDPASTPVTIERLGDLMVLHYPPGDDALRFAWKSAPRRLLVASDSGGPFAAPAPVGALRKDEKRLLVLAPPEVTVVSLARLTHDPAGGWKREQFEKSGPASSSVDLNRDSVGPHAVPGKYQRIWIVRYEHSGSVSQRQVASGYEVTEAAVRTGSDEFLRR